MESNGDVDTYNLICGCLIPMGFHLLKFMLKTLEVDNSSIVDTSDTA